jgi:hypothetical protein
MRDERGTGHQGLNTQDVAQLIEGKPEGTEGFAIKQLGHLRGPGILPRGTWPRDYTNDNKVGFATLAVIRTLVRLVLLGIDC